jgi:hypothetical protein
MVMRLPRPVGDVVMESLRAAAYGTERWVSVPTRRL